jgi:hypothetical protein
VLADADVEIDDDTDVDTDDDGDEDAKISHSGYEQTVGAEDCCAEYVCYLFVCC